ncbi:MAG TPA: glycerol-3-phosphate dehydrogenase/oxidase [Armatimonadota bacterium]|nr:glycerol-3-phosphate dehydrogenase/oxidase [Armatimonadota bacterium]
MLSRDEMLNRLRTDPDPWDLIVIGGGATGVGIAIDAASRGYKTALVERYDFGKGTSSRSTKLAHGGVRYLQQGNISLVLEALRERGLLRQNAPHLVHDLSFVVPRYDWWEGGFYGFGLKVYDIMAGRQGFGQSSLLSLEKTVERIPTIETNGLRGGVMYYDGQFDDARLIVNMVQTAAEQGAILVNYLEARSLIKSEDVVSGIVAEDAESGEQIELRGKVVVNATGPFTDSVRRMDDPDARPMIDPSQGVHIVLDRSFLPGDSAIMVPHTDDGRVLFAIPWHDSVVIGTTDTPVEEILVEPRPFREEIDFLLSHAARYMTKDPTKSDVLSVFVGIRPLVGSSDAENTAALSRDHTVHISNTGLVTIAGGKWTTYRKMAEDAVNQAALLGQLEIRDCVTADLPIHGFHRNAERFGNLSVYGSDAPALQSLLNTNPEYGERIHPGSPHLVGEIVWAVRREMARTVEDFLSRRTRALLLGAKTSIEMAPKVAQVMAAELGNDESWQCRQVAAYTTLAKGYSLGP